MLQIADTNSHAAPWIVRQSLEAKVGKESAPAVVERMREYAEAADIFRKANGYRHGKQRKRAAIR